MVMMLDLEIEIEDNSEKILLFWNSLSKISWLYISDEILTLLGYTRDKYINGIKNNFKFNIDYMVLNSKLFKTFVNNNKTNMSICDAYNTHNKTKHILISKTAFKLSILNMNTNISDYIRLYYINLEQNCSENNNQNDLLQLNTSIDVDRREEDKKIQTILDNYCSCIKCNQTFTNDKDLLNHLNQKISCNDSKKDVKYVCNKCQLKCRSNSELQRHLNRKLPCDIILKCEHCQQIFKALYNYNKHINKKQSCINVLTNK